MFRLEISEQGMPALADRIEGMEQRLEDGRPVLHKIADSFNRREELAFESRGFGTWTPLSRPYAAWKALHHPGLPELVLTGTLRRSLVTHGSAQYSIRRVTKDSLVVGTSAPSAHLLKRQGRNPIPDVTDAEVSVWVLAIRRYVTGGEQ